MIDIRSTIKFGKSARFPGGRSIGQRIGGQGSTQKAARQARELVNRQLEFVTSGRFRDLIGARVLDILKARTLAGKDCNSGPLAPYTPRYLKRKQRAGRYSGKVDLKYSGAMLDALAFYPLGPLKGIVKLKPGRVGKITLTALGRIHHRGEGRQPKREWFAWKRGSADDRRLKLEMRLLMTANARRAKR